MRLLFFIIFKLKYVRKNSVAINQCLNTPVSSNRTWAQLSTFSSSFGEFKANGAMLPSTPTPEKLEPTLSWRPRGKAPQMNKSKFCKGYVVHVQITQSHSLLSVINKEMFYTNSCTLYPRFHYFRFETLEGSYFTSPQPSNIKLIWAEMEGTITQKTEAKPQNLS